MSLLSRLIPTPNISSPLFSGKRMRGFSLVEILIGVSIASVAGVILISLLSQNSSLVSDQNVKINQGLEINTARPLIDETLKAGSSIVSQYPATGSPTYTTGTESIVLSVPSINAQGLTINNTYDYLVLFKDPDNPRVLKKKLIVDPLSTRSSEDRVLLTKLSSIQFTYLNSSGQEISPTQASKIRYIVNVTDLVATEEKMSSVSGTINLRNN